MTTGANGKQRSAQREGRQPFSENLQGEPLSFSFPHPLIKEGGQGDGFIWGKRDCRNGLFRPSAEGLAIATFFYYIFFYLRYNERKQVEGKYEI